MAVLRLTFLIFTLPGEIWVFSRRLPSPPALPIWLILIEATSKACGVAVVWAEAASAAAQAIHTTVILIPLTVRTIEMSRD